MQTAAALTKKPTTHTYCALIKYLWMGFEDYFFFPFSKNIWDGLSSMEL